MEINGGLLVVNNPREKNRNAISIFSPSNQSVSELTNLLADKKIFDYLIDRKNQNERLNENQFNGFTDLEMIYYYSYLPKDVDKKKDRDPVTQKTYIRELVSFYKHIVSYESYLRDDVNEQSETSLFRLIRERHMSDYLKWLTIANLGRGNEPYSVSTRSKKITIIKSFLNWLYKVGFIEHNITLGLPSSKISDDDRPNRDLSFNEVSQILDFYKGHLINHTILSILATTGARAAEIANSKFGNLYYDSFRGEYWLKIIGKGNKKREILIFNNVFDEIMAFRKRRGQSTELNANDDSPLFTTKIGKAYTPNYLSHYVAKIISKTNLPFLDNRQSRISAHNFRHFFAIYSAQNGAPIYYISRTLGHESIKTTELYLEKHVDKENNVAHFWDQSKF